MGEPPVGRASRLPGLAVSAQPAGAQLVDERLNARLLSWCFGSPPNSGRVKDMPPESSTVVAVAHSHPPSNVRGGTSIR